MKQIISFCLIALISAFATVLQATAQDADGPYVIIVEFVFDEANIDNAIELLAEMQMQTLENEEGCLAYDVLLSDDEPTKIYIYENYENEAAFKLHSNSAYFKSIVQGKLKPLIKHEKITKVTPILQDGGETGVDAEL